MVMGNTKWKHLLRSIRKSGISFLAVAVIASVSIAIFQGFQSSAIAILQRADRYFNENNLETLEISCANGITQEDLEAIADWEGVQTVEGGYSDSVQLVLEGKNVLVQARSLLDTINTPVVLEGSLPTAENEAAIEEILAEEQGVQVGDTITLHNDGNLKKDTFEVTAIINQPNFVCADVEDSRGTGTAGLGSNEYYVALTAGAFDADYFSNCYTTAYIDSSVLDGVYYFSDDYQSGESEYLALLEPLAQQRAELRYQQLDQEVAEELSDAQQEIDDAKAEIEENQTKIDDAKAEIEENQRKVDDAKAEIEENQAKIDDAREQIDQGEQELADAKSELVEKRALLETSKTQLDSQLAAMGLPTDLNQALTALEPYGEAGAALKAAIVEYQSGDQQVQAAQQQIAASEEQLNVSRQELEASVQELEQAKTEVSDAEQELAEAKAEIADSEQELADAKVEVSDAEQEFADAEAEAQDLQLENWILSGRENVGDIRGIETIVDCIFGLSYSMSAIFLLVAMVISFAAITRVIREQRILIGAQKALGFTAGEIFKHYMLYNLSCAVLGILLGWFLSVSIVELMSLNIFVPKFLLGKVSIVFAGHTALISAGICLVVFLAATFLTCSKLIKEPATDLLRGESPARGKQLFFEKWGVYQRMNLYSRTMIKNVLNDKGRMMTTIVGVMGCTALLVACFSMKLGIQNAAGTEFSQYAFYDYRLVVDSESGRVQDFADLLDGEGIHYTLVQDKLKNFRVQGGNWENVHVLTTDDFEALAEDMNLVDIATGNTAQVSGDGVLVSRRAAEELDLSEGSTIELMDDKGRSKEATVSGVIEHYLPYHLIVTSDSYYETVMEQQPDHCVFLLQGDIGKIAETVQGMDGYLNLLDNSNYDNSGSELNLVIGICVTLSAVMSVLVLLNQITMYIDRKARELAVMRVNGYTMQQTKAYVYKDNIVLTALGLLIGCIFGVGLSYLDIRIIEAGAEHFVRSPNLLACLISCGIIAVFALIVNLLALRRIEHLSLTNVSAN